MEVTTRNRMRATAGVCLLALIAAALPAQERVAVTVDTIVLRVNGEATFKPFVVASPDASTRLDELRRDTRNSLVTRSALRGIDGATSALKMGRCAPFCVGVNLEVTPRIESSGGLMLHVLISQVFISEYVNLGSLLQGVLNQNQNTFDVKAASGETTLLGGLWPVRDGKAGSLVIALTPKIVP
jgi:hypothetical protein